MLTCYNYNTLSQGNASFWLFFLVIGWSDTLKASSLFKMACEVL